MASINDFDQEALQRAFGQEMRELREADGKPPEATASALGVDLSDYLKLEAGALNASVATVRRVAQFYDLTLQVMMERIVARARAESEAP